MGSLQCISPIAVSSYLICENIWVALKRADWVCYFCLAAKATKAVQSATLPLEGVYHIHCSDGLPLGMLRVGDGISDHILEEHLQHAPSLLVDESGNTLHASSAGQTSDSRLGDALDIVPQDFPVPLSPTFSKALSALAFSSHGSTGV